MLSDLGGLVMNKPHTYEVTIPSFSDITDFFDEVGDAAEEIAKDFKAVPVVNNENGDEAAVDHSAASP